MKEKSKGYISFPKEFLDYDITLQEALLLADICGLAVNNKIKSGACIASNKYLSFGKCSEIMVQKRLANLKKKNLITVVLTKNSREGIYPNWDYISVSQNFWKGKKTTETESEFVSDDNLPF